MVATPASPQDILVVGAGAAGLMAALDLAQAGRRVVLLEARARCGGRVFPLPAATFGYAAEAGAEYIHGAAPLTRTLLAEAGLATVPLTGRRWTRHAGTWRPREAAPHEERFAAALAGLSADEPVADLVARDFAGPDYAALRELVEREVRGYNNADPRRFSSFALRDQWLDPDAERQERVDEGYGALIDRLRARVLAHGAVLHLETEVVAVEVAGAGGAGGARLRCRGGRVFEGAAAVLTLPLPLLRRLALPAGLAGAVAAADAAIGYGPVVKMHLRFAAPWWRDLRPDFADLHAVFGLEAPVPVWWTQHPRDRPVITGWTSAYKVAEAGARSEAEWRALGFASLGAVFDRPAAALERACLAAHVMRWGDDPFAGGAYSYPTPETAAALAALRAATAGGPLYLAGEALHQGGETGTVEAALASGRAAARQALAAA